LGEINVSGEVLLAWVSQRIGGLGVVAKSHEGAGGAGGVVECGRGETVVESENDSLLNFFRKKFDPWADAGPEFGGEAFDGRNRPVGDLLKKFGWSGLIEPFELAVSFSDEAFVPLARVKADEANGKAIDQFARVEEGGIRLSWQRGDVGMPMDRDFREKGLK
jgi:hypothetical protein